MTRRMAKTKMSRQRAGVKSTWMSECGARWRREGAERGEKAAEEGRHPLAATGTLGSKSVLARR